MTGPLSVRPVSATEHLDFVDSCASASYLQCPSWGVMPPRWTPESVGWFDGPVLRGVGLVLYRRVPAVGSLAYIGEGPVVDWAELGPERILEALLAYLRTRGVFSVKVAPDLVLRRWGIETLRSVLRSPGPGRLRDVPPDEVGEVAASVVAALRDQGWTQYEAPGPGFGGQMHPRYRSHVPLAPDADPAERLDSQWRRNLRKATGSGVVVTTGGAGDLPTFFELYAETAARDGFPPLPLEFFERMWRSLRERGPDAAGAVPRRPGGAGVRGGAAHAGRGGGVLHPRRVGVGRARVAAEQRDAVADAAGRACRRRERLRPARHLGHPRPGRPAVRAAAVQDRARR